MRRRRPGIALAAAALAVALGHAPLRAQAVPPRITVRVRQVAGASLYLDVGTDQGLAAGDTLTVARDTLTAPVGRLTVTAASPTRSVLTFAGPAFPVTRGAGLALTLARAPSAPVPEGARPALAAVHDPTQPPGPSRAGGGGPPHGDRPRPRPHGRVGVDVATLRSTTRFGETPSAEVGRTFATPAFRLDLTAPEAVGGFDLRLGARLAYRYADQDLGEAAASARVYAAALDRRFQRIPLRLELGRFHAPDEVYSGFWDGIHARWGGPWLGVGVLVGFQPDRWNERPSLERRKASVVLDATRRGAGWSWSGDLSAHTVGATDSLPAHAFAGLSQRLGAGELRLAQDLQADRDPDSGRWRVSRLDVRASVAVSAKVDLRAAYSRRESYLDWRPAEVFDRRRDRVSAGLAVRAGSGRLAADVSRSTEPGSGPATGYSASLLAPGLAPGPASLEATASYWKGEAGRLMTAAPAVSMALGDARLRLGYRMYRSDYLQRSLTTQGGEASADVGLGPGLRASVRIRVERGASLRSDALTFTLYRVF